MKNNRKAVIRNAYVDNKALKEKIYVVDLYENNKLIESRHLPDKSLYYAEDVMENWENGIIQIENTENGN